MSSNKHASALAEKPLKQKERKEVHVTSHQGHVDHDTIRLSKSAADEVSWFSYDNSDAIIVFASPDGSPFVGSQFYVSAGGSHSSGKIRTNAEKKAYKYTVVGDSGVNDPVIIIED